MSKLEIKRNERDWAGQLISWIKDAINKKTTVFQDVTNDTGVKMESGRTKFPDVLLFTDKISGIVFNGWELKFPDTAVDDSVMLENALEKAKRLKSDSFVTWNGSEAIIWKIDTNYYSIETLSKLKTYPKIPTIISREDLADPAKYTLHEPILRERANNLLHDLDLLCRNGELKPAIDISENIIKAIRYAADVIVPQFQVSIMEKKGNNYTFRSEFATWKIYESSTLKILETSSRRNERVIPEQVLANFMFYNLIGKILFYLTLSDNLSGELDSISIHESKNMQSSLNSYFNCAKNIDYQAIFKPYFTDCLEYSETTNVALVALLNVLTDFDFKILPTEVIGNILENLVPHEEKQKFGQYFTPETLANLVAYPAIKTKNDVLFDPTSGTGTFLNSFYHILAFHGNKSHVNLLNQIWGNDVSHFPAILSVINLYKQDVTETENFPRVIRDDFFNIKVGDSIEFPSSYNHNQKIKVSIPAFDGIVSNFPFIQQEDIPNDALTMFFREKFQKEQRAFLKDNNFKINERSDYFTYCIYNSIRFLKPDGCLSAITSNAWLGKEYGFQFKRFLLDNFHIKYIVKSNAEHWFKDSQVSTVFFVLERKCYGNDTKFITINFKLEEHFTQDDIDEQIQQIEDFYSDIDNCNNTQNNNWVADDNFCNLYKRKDESISVCIVPNNILMQSLTGKDNWDKFFISTDLFASFEHCLIQYYPRIMNVFRGERTGWNDMFIISDDSIVNSHINSKYLMPYIKKPSELNRIKFDENYQFRIFVCNDAFDNLDTGTKAWINKFQGMQNKNGSKTIQEACIGHRPYWYSLNPKKANIITAINPYERFFFTYSELPFAIDQRLIAMQVCEYYDIELIAALLNSTLTFLTLEMRGTSRNLGALDLNADYLKTFKGLNPFILSEEQKHDIIKAFEPLKHREVKAIQDEINMPDRIKFDKVIFRSFGLDISLLSNIYSLLSASVSNRVSISERK